MRGRKRKREEGEFDGEERQRAPASRRFKERREERQAHEASTSECNQQPHTPQKHNQIHPERLRAVELASVKGADEGSTLGRSFRRRSSAVVCGGAYQTSVAVNPSRPGRKTRRSQHGQHERENDGHTSNEHHQTRLGWAGGLSHEAADERLKLKSKSKSQSK